MTTAETQVWRVVCEGGEVREVAAVYAAEVSAWAATGEATLAMGDVVRAINATARRAVMSYAMRAHWPVVEIVAPGVLTAAERLAQVTAGRDAAVAARDALVTAVRAERAERDEADASEPSPSSTSRSAHALHDANLRHMNAAIAATDALLDGAPADVVRGDVVRPLLAAERSATITYAAAMVRSAVDRDESDATVSALSVLGAAATAARAALDAALAPGGGR